MLSHDCMYDVLAPGHQANASEVYRVVSNKYIVKVSAGELAAADLPYAGDYENYADAMRLADFINSTSYDWEV